MSLLFKFYNHLQSNPRLGVASGFASGLIYRVRSLLTNEEVLKVVAGIGAFAGTAVAILTLIVYLVKVFDIFSERIKKFKSHKNEDITKDDHTGADSHGKPPVL